mmetsp:Transcript_68156/g.110587  ORF Transcript_68156/g.110587 Transcript_68156/m.110587 type:complete len:80 (+) Transcript_68156:371-610(+)
MHHQTDLYQAATRTLSAGDFIPIIHITGVYLSPDSKVPTSEIKDLYTTLSNNFGVGVLGGRVVQDYFPFLLCEVTYVVV